MSASRKQVSRVVRLSAFSNWRAIMASTSRCRSLRGGIFLAAMPRRRQRASLIVLHRTCSMGFGVPDKVAKNRTALQRLMVGLAVQSSRANSSRKEANSKGATGSTSSWRRRANDAHFAKYSACLLMELCFRASPKSAIMSGVVRCGRGCGGRVRAHTGQVEEAVVPATAAVASTEPEPG